MKPSTHDTSARQHSGEPSTVPGHGGKRNYRPGKPGAAEADGEITGLLNRSTQDLRLGWRKLHRSGPPLGLSRDLMIRALANELQERAHGGPSAALRRRLQTLGREFEYEGQHYRSLTVIAGRITGAHWSGPRFFGLTQRARALVAAAGR